MLRSLRFPHSLVLLALALPAVAAAQGRVSRDADVRSTPDGNVVASVRNGTSWTTGASRRGWTLITLQGWVDASRFAGRRDSFPESVGASAGLRLREGPSLEGRILGELRAGAGIRVLERRGSWARVRRDAWISAAALTTSSSSKGSAPPARPTTTAAKTSTKAPSGTPAAPAGAPTEMPADAPASPASPDALRANGTTPMFAAPSGAAVGRLEAGAIVEPVARERGWVRVRMEGWVAESLLTPTDTAFGATVTAMDLRMDPAGHKGRIVRWGVQVVGLQKADALRRDLAVDEPYLLAMGPGDENAILYVAIPPSLLTEARALAPLAKVIITARVRNGRAEPTGAPVLELISLVKR